MLWQTQMHSKIAGVSIGERQQIIRELKVGDELILEREPNNEFDKNAIKVITKDGKHIGYINRNLAADLADAIDRGMNYICIIGSLTGQSYQNYGVNIIISLKEVSLKDANERYNIQ